MTTPHIPPLSLALAYGPALLQAAFGVAAWLTPHPVNLYASVAGRIWAAAILLFLAGVRRGLGFFAAGGSRPAQVATSLWLFATGLAGLLLPPIAALVALAAGYLSVALLDPPAAQRGEVPDYFARLRPPQMTIFLAGLGLLAFR